MLADERDSSGWVLKALREAGNSLLSELHGLDGDTLCRRPAGDDWSLTEITAHLRDAEELALRQLTAISERARGPLPFWDIDVLPLERDYRSADVSRLLAEFRALRRQTSGLLWDLASADWQTAGRHPYRGEVTIQDVARELAQHDLEHLWQVRRLKSELGAAGARDDDW
ncbi:MAG: DinB family protein [Dehalococcoidia bacterium]|nr:DinB family protein [Dehalococcoidia bacterium]